jgi:hypothetical protein
MTQKELSRHFISTNQLAKLKVKAQRSGAWFTALKRIDRALIDLTIRVASTIRNAILVKSVLAIASKVESAMATKIPSYSEEIGFLLAHKLAAIAVKFGNALARMWASDFRFARFLAIMHFNDSRRTGL